jgi:hypothetical protein
MAGGVEDLDGQLAQGQLVALAVEVQILDLGGQGEELAAGTVGVGLMDIDLGVGQGLVEVGYGGGLVIVTVGQEDGRNLLAQAWWIAVFPGAFITATVIAATVLGRRLARPGSERTS